MEAHFVVQLPFIIVFGPRATLQLLMRPADIKTTMDYYVAQDVDDVASELWSDHKRSHKEAKGELGATTPNSQEKECPPDAVTS
ncbi:hypothetical protein [Symmachiella macrocystis]|uniref:hypothetical protein n=1 Tax=Symmachiella macrocystis TaxID=2527985 RepID=UPI0011B76947|nr:hypothetical protein [Symmachiella macrocystis]